MRAELLLVEREEPACRRDAVDARGDQFVRRVGKAPKQVAVVERVDDLVRYGAMHDLVLHRERPGLRVADVAVETLELSVEHQDADRHPVIGAVAGAVIGRRLGHDGITWVAWELIDAEASAASKS